MVIEDSRLDRLWALAVSTHDDVMRSRHCGNPRPLDRHVIFLVAMVLLER